MRSSNRSIEPIRNAEPVAFWDFSELEPPFTTRLGTADYPLTDGYGSRVTTFPDGPFGNAAVFDGERDYLKVPFQELGDLDIGRIADACTVLAWVKRSDTRMHFIAGRWDEDDAGGTPGRQYGLFVNLLPPRSDRVGGHISYRGGSSAGYVYNRDYSASARRVTVDRWRLIGFRYDGRLIESLMDGLPDQYSDYTDELGKTYHRNPYAYADGINPRSACDFTVGATKLGRKLPSTERTHGMGLFLAGHLGGLAIFPRALELQEFMRIHLATALEGPSISLDFDDLHGYGVQPASSFGWRSLRGDLATDTAGDIRAGNFAVSRCPPNSFLFRSAVADSENKLAAGFSYFGDIHGIKLKDVASVSFLLNNSTTDDPIHLAICADGEWLVHNDAVSAKHAAESAFDWNNAEMQIVDVANRDEEWLPLQCVAGSRLWLGNQPREPAGNANLTAVGIYSPPLASDDSVIRVGKVAVRLKG